MGYVLTAIAAVLYVFMGIAFADDYFTSTFFNSETWVDSSASSWVLLAAIIAGGVIQANKLPEDGVVLGPASYIPVSMRN